MTCDQYNFGQNKLKLVITWQNVNFSAFWRHCKALVRNHSSIENALKFTFHAYAFTWQILLRILFALKFKTPRIISKYIQYIFRFLILYVKSYSCLPMVWLNAVAQSVVEFSTKGSSHLKPSFSTKLAWITVNLSRFYR